MRNVKLLIQYDGTSYSGWQKQPNAPTIQQEIETKLSIILKESINLIGSGRTDTGVHAIGQVANFKTNTNLNCEQIFYAINSFLNRDIRVIQCEEVHPDFHARFSVIKRQYKYIIYNELTYSPFTRDYSYFIKKPVDVDKLKNTLKRIIGEYDFTSFASAKDDSKNKVRTIYEIDVQKSKNEIIIFITANGFLRKMVRMILGTAIEINLKNYPIEDISRILALKSRKHTFFTIPSKGLYLNHVWY